VEIYGAGLFAFPRRSLPFLLAFLAFLLFHPDQNPKRFLSLEAAWSLLALDVSVRGHLLTELLEVLRLVRGREQKLVYQRVGDYAGGGVSKKPTSFLSYLLQNPLC